MVSDAMLIIKVIFMGAWPLWLTAGQRLEFLSCVCTVGAFLKHF